MFRFIKRIIKLAILAAIVTFIMNNCQAAIANSPVASGALVPASPHAKPNLLTDRHMKMMNFNEIPSVYQKTNILPAISSTTTNIIDTDVNNHFIRSCNILPNSQNLKKRKPAIARYYIPYQVHYGFLLGFLLI